jgi:FkbM family methyltransferase
MKGILLALIKTGATLPAGVKGGITERIFNRILRSYKARYSTSDSMVASNLGMGNGLQATVPVLQAPGFLLFGTPRSYPGEYYTLQLARALNEHCDAFVDIGANWGYYTYFIAPHSNRPVYWFEPNPFLFQHISNNIKANRLHHVTGSDTAISDTTGQLTFYLDQSSDLQSSIIRPNDVPVKEHTVPSVRFDDWAGDSSIPNKLLVKVDVENAEWHFIRGVGKGMKKIEFLLMEVLGPARQSGFINHVINDLKLQAYYINKDRVEFVRKEDMRYTKGEYNWLFCRHLPSELQQKLAGSIFTVVE